MALPKIDVPIYSVELPSTGAVVKYRPFLVREQKQLLIAQNSGMEQQVQAVINMVQTCTFDSIDVIKLPAYDLEYLFLQLRASSVGENIDMVLTCGKCENKQDAVLNLLDVKIQKSELHTDTIDLGQGIILKMQDPSLVNLGKIRNTTNPGVDEIIELIASCITTIWKNEDMYSVLDYSQTELIEFIENLSPQAFSKLESFFVNMPKLKHVMNFKCDKCQEENSAALEGLQSFFG